MLERRAALFVGATRSQSGGDGGDGGGGGELFGQGLNKQSFTGRELRVVLLDLLFIKRVSSVR